MSNFEQVSDKQMSEFPTLKILHVPIIDDDTFMYIVQYKW